MTNFFSRIESTVRNLKEKIAPSNTMNSFFQTGYKNLVETPNGSREWWHHMPLPNGDRVKGVNEDRDMQLKMWRAMGIANEGGLAGKRVLDIGANDGFFTVAAYMAGAQSVTSVDKDWRTWPLNLNYASEQWQVTPKVVTADFRTHDFQERFDVIFFLGVLYHLEDVFGAMRTLHGLLNEDGVMYMETQMSGVQSDLPIFESASDIYPTIAAQGKKQMGMVGISNYLFPNMHAVRSLAHTTDFQCETLDGPNNVYSQELPHRQFFKFIKQSQPIA